MRRSAAYSVLALFAAFLAMSHAGATQTGPLRLAIAGDTHGYHIVDNPALDGEDLLADVRPVLGKADLFLFNHEGTLIDNEDVAKSCRKFSNQSTFATPPEFAARLDPGIEAVASLANNHAMDCGVAGLTRTKQAFADAGISTVGAGMDLSEACAPLELSIEGVSIAIVSYLYEDPALLSPGMIATDTDPGVATLDGCDAESTLRGLSDRDLVVVLLHAHYGSSWVYGASPQHVAAVDDLFSWGADLVASSGPHFLQGVLTSSEPRAFAFTGLGDFMFGQPPFLPPQAKQSMLALVEVERSTIARAWLYPFELRAGLPSKPATDRARDQVSLVDDLSEQYDSDVMRLGTIGLVQQRRAIAMRAR